jgi:hypothetical protein
MKAGDEQSMNGKRRASSRPGSTKKSAGSARPARVDPARTHGRRRPNRVRVPSESRPETGCDTASKIRSMKSARPTSAGDIPR